LNEIWGFNSIYRVTILTEVHVLHACEHFSLSKPALQEIIGCFDVFKDRPFWAVLI